MRSWLVALTLSISTTAYAQPVRGAAQPVAPKQTPSSPPSRPLHAQRTHPPQSPPQTVAPPMVFPLPPLMPPPAGGLTSGFPGFFSQEAMRSQGSPSHRRGTTPNYGFFPGYAGPAYAVADEPNGGAAEAAAAEAPGMLRVAVTPTAAQVFVDGFYVGTADEVDARRGFVLAAGPHRIEMRAPAYRTLTFDVRIVPNDAITYRGALEPAAIPPAAPPATPRSAAPMYVIPNCYIGNVPPRASRVPAGCDVAKVQVLR